jgi:aspartate aminotransferase
MRPYTIFVDAVSKVFAATGVRVGWTMGPAPILAKMRAILSHIGAWAPMAEQKGLALFLQQHEAITTYLDGFKQNIALRLQGIYDGLQQLKAEGFAVDAVAPEAAIYLTIKMELTGKRKADGSVLHDQAAVTAYLLEEAKLAIVPFYAFGAPKASPWYRLSVGTCREEEIGNMLAQLRSALEKLK